MAYKLKEPITLLQEKYQYVAIGAYSYNEATAIFLNQTNSDDFLASSIVATVNIDVWSSRTGICLDVNNIGEDNTQTIAKALQDNDILDLFNGYANSGMVNNYPSFELGSKGLELLEDFEKSSEEDQD